MNIKKGIQKARKKGVKGTCAYLYRRIIPGKNKNANQSQDAKDKELYLKLTHSLFGLINNQISALTAIILNENLSGKLKDDLFEVLENQISALTAIILNENLSGKLKDDLFSSIKRYEDVRGYKTYLKRKYIKSVLPKTYNEYSHKPIENKMVFVQPRNGLNQSCRYIFKTIENQNKFTPVLYELGQGDLPLTRYYENAVEFVKGLATAKACFVHESNDLLGYIDIRPETKIIQLWHGCGVLKKIGLSTADMPGFKSSKDYQEFPEYNKYDLVTIASPELSWVFEEFMGIGSDADIIRPIGVSRTDEFFDEAYINNSYNKIHEKIPASKTKKVILYAPTYRGVGQDRVAPEALDIEAFAEALSDDYVLVIKQHQTVRTLPPIPESVRDSFAFDMTRGKGMNINELMAVADICISDYSSLVFEYALFERPMIFFAYDLEDYIDDRGLYYPFDEITPGPICRTTREMIDYIKNIDSKFDRQQVTDFKNKFMCSCDGHATERILAFAEA